MTEIERLIEEQAEQPPVGQNGGGQLPGALSGDIDELAL